MNHKERQDWLKVKYPLTVVTDRYSGTYSGAIYLAFPLDFDEVPKDVNGDDTECAYFWKNYEEPVGKGASAQEAIDDLVAKMSDTTYKICSKCGARMKVRQGVRTFSIPPMHIYDCPECGNEEYDSILYPCDLGELATQSKNEVDLCDKTDYKKKYEAALQTARQWIADGCTDKERIAIEAIFPELAESESEDERIREQIEQALIEHDWSVVYRVSKEDCLAWLEKQKTSEEALRYVKENHSPDEVSDFQAAMNIAVAKAYDRGVQDTLEKQEEQKQEWSEEDEKMIQSIVLELQGLIECSPNPPGFEIRVRKEQNWLKSLHPQKLDASKLENFDPVDVLNEIKTKWPMAWEKVVEKQEWSEEDEQMINTLVSYVEDPSCWKLKCPRKKLVAFIESLPKRFSPQPKWKPSEDEERLINTSISFLKDFADKGYENAVECIDWLKSKLNGNTGK